MAFTSERPAGGRYGTKKQLVNYSQKIVEMTTWRSFNAKSCWLIFSVSQNTFLHDIGDPFDEFMVI